MKNVRTYGTAPFQVAVIHGGPGAPGEMAPVARELSLLCGVLEPLQTKTTVAEQVEELATVLRALVREVCERAVLRSPQAGVSLGRVIAGRFKQTHRAVLA